MAEMEEASVDAVVCDPPYGLSFMGQAWDTFDPADMEKRVGTRESTGPASDVHDGRSKGRTKSAFANAAGEAGAYDFSLSANRRYQAWCEAWAREAFRVLKPGGLLLACGGSRTHHRLASGIEDAGFEIRDRIDTPDGRTVETPDGTLAWFFGSGFPKSTDVHKALSKWATRVARAWLLAPYGSASADRKLAELLAVVSELEDPVEDAEWEGWGTSLKPAHEPIVVARKPFKGTVAENVLEHGTGGINVDACRIAGQPRATGTKADDASAGSGNVYMGVGSDGAQQQSYDENLPAGRWPANVVLSHLEECEAMGARRIKNPGGVPKAGSEKASEPTFTSSERTSTVHHFDEDGTETVEAWNCAPGCPVAELDAQSGVLKSGFMAAGTEREGLGYRGGLGNRVRNDTHADSGGASRFFYCAKTSRAERNAWLEGFEVGDDKEERYRLVKANPSRKDGGANETRPSANGHPTVKPINLMRWLVRLITPPGGTCLDPFLGSGSTGCAAVLEGFNFIGIEREAEYIAIAEARISFWAQHEGREVEDVLGLHSISQRQAKAHADVGQLALEEAA